MTMSTEAYDSADHPGAAEEMHDLQSRLSSFDELSSPCVTAFGAILNSRAIGSQWSCAMLCLDNQGRS